jgi:Ni/Fe-hydrogenase subunit HybB-like protein
VLARFADLSWREATMHVDRYAAMFWIETVLFVVPALMVLRREQSLGRLLRAAMLVAFAGALYRFDTFLVAFDPGPGWSYFPSVTEQLVTIGLVAAEVAIYIAVVKYFPILSGAEGERA